MTLRLPEDVCQQVAPIVARRGISVNQFVTDAVRRAIEAEEDRLMEEAAEILASDPEECDVEYAFAAQAEVVLRDEG